MRCETAEECQYAGCDEPGLTTCHEGVCYTGTRTDACDGVGNGDTELFGGTGESWCWDGRRDRRCPHNPDHTVSTQCASMDTEGECTRLGIQGQPTQQLVCVWVEQPAACSAKPAAAAGAARAALALKGPDECAAFNSVDAEECWNAGCDCAQTYYDPDNREVCEQCVPQAPPDPATTAAVDGVCGPGHDPPPYYAPPAHRRVEMDGETKLPDAWWCQDCNW
jgi:hypothetical protein